MKYNIQFIQTPIREASRLLAIKKLESLGKKFHWIIRSDVFFKEEKDTYGKGKICEIQLSVPGSRIFASSDEDSFEAAVSETMRDLEKQLKTRKDDMQTY